MRKVLLATPCYGGQVTTPTAMSVELALYEGRENGWDIRWLPLVGSADIADMRNQFLGLLLASECTDLLFIDADVSFGAGTLTRIMAHNVDLVAGLYRKRQDEVDYPVGWPDVREMWTDPETGFPLLKALQVPAGFMRITRKCLDLMTSVDDVRWMADPAQIMGKRYPFLFDWTWAHNGDQMERKSEDYTFCQRFREAGGTVWADPSLKLNHTGQKTFEGDYMGYLQRTLAEEARPTLRWREMA